MSFCTNCGYLLPSDFRDKIILCNPCRESQTRSNDLNLSKPCDCEFCRGSYYPSQDSSTSNQNEVAQQGNSYNNRKKSKSKARPSKSETSKPYAPEPSSIQYSRGLEIEDDGGKKQKNDAGWNSQLTDELPYAESDNYHQSKEWYSEVRNDFQPSNQSTMDWADYDGINPIHLNPTPDDPDDWNSAVDWNISDYPWDDTDWTVIPNKKKRSPRSKLDIPSNADEWSTFDQFSQPWKEDQVSEEIREQWTR